MNKQDIREIFEYNYWANYRLLDMTEKVTPEQFTAPSSHSFSTLQGTLVHTLDAEWGWRVLLQSGGSTELLKNEDFPTVDVLRQRWQEEEKAMWDYINGLSDDGLAGIITYPIEDGQVRERVLWHCLFHVVNHGMQHRSEAANLLTIYGQSPGEIDFTMYLNELKAAQK